MSRWKNKLNWTDPSTGLRFVQKTDKNDKMQNEGRRPSINRISKEENHFIEYFHVKPRDNDNP
jgi:hypothetical protein